MKFGFPKREEIARYGMTLDEVMMHVETAIGGMAVDRTIEGRERYTINVRYGREFRHYEHSLRVVEVLERGGAGLWRRHVRFDHLDERLAAIPECREGGAEEQREHHDLQDLVLRHAFEDGSRHEVRDELLQCQRGRRDAGLGRRPVRRAPATAQCQPLMVRSRPRKRSKSALAAVALWIFFSFFIGFAADLAADVAGNSPR